MTSPVAVRTNYIICPQPDSTRGGLHWDVLNAAGGAATQTTPTGDGPTGGSYLRTTFTTAGSSGVAGPYTYSGGTWMVTGTTYTASVWVRSSVPVSVPVAIEWHATPTTGQAIGAMVSASTGAAVALAAGQWTRISVTDICPAGATQAVLTLYSAVGLTAGATFDATMALLEAAATVGPYFDGDTPSTVTDSYAWVGLAKASQSTDTPASAPAASFTASPSIGPAPLAVAFTDTSSGGPTGWAWTFGDGSVSTAQNPSYSYPTAGSYTVTLTASNVIGQSVAALTVTVTVAAAGAGPGSAPAMPAARGPSAGLLTEWAAPQTEWTYVFTDALTDTELAVLPMVGVTFEKVLNGTGKLTGYIPTGNATVRALNPWAATRPRRSSVYVYFGELLVWGGMVWSSEVVSGFPGIKIMAATFESWLVTQFLLADMSFTGQTAVGMFTSALAQVQAVSGANMHFQVLDGSPAPGAEIVRPDTTWKRIDLKDPLTLLGTFLNTQTPLEWRIDLARQASGVVTKQLLIGEPRIGRSTDVSGLYAWHDAEDPASTLLTFDDLNDGAVQANAAAGSIPDPNGTNQLTQRLFAYHDSVEIGVDELGAGYPRMMRAVSTMDRGVITQNDLDDAVLGAVADAMSQGKQMTSFGLRIDAPPVGSYDVGDDMDCQIVHPGYEDWPTPQNRSVRILGRKITPRGPSISAAVGDPWGGSMSATSSGGSHGDKVELTVWDADSPRLPRSTTLVAHIRDLIRRVKSLEIA